MTPRIFWQTIWYGKWWNWREPGWALFGFMWGDDGLTDYKYVSVVFLCWRFGRFLSNKRRIELLYPHNLPEKE